MERILFRCDVSNDKLEWSSPQAIDINIRDQSRLALSNKGVDALAISPKTKALYDSINFMKETKEIQVKFNLTEPVAVLENNLVSLLNTTIILTSSTNGAGKYQDWKLSGIGQEVILGKPIIQYSMLMNKG